MESCQNTLRSSVAWGIVAAWFNVACAVHAQPAPEVAGAGDGNAGSAPTQAPPAAKLEPSSAVQKSSPSSVADEQGDEQEENLVITGTRIPRTRIETPVPVDVISGRDMARNGQNETARMLSILAPSYNAPAVTIADGSDHLAPAALRGLGPDQVLVLVNGKRRHPTALVHVNGTFGRGTAGTDLNAIPASAIHHIEVLRDGAATQYGSDAIAGVINIVLKEDVNAVDISAGAGITGEGDGAQFRATANTGAAIGQDGGFVHIAAEFLQRDATNRSGRYGGTIFSEDGSDDNDMLRALGLDRDDFSMRIGEGEATVGMLMYNLEIPLSEQWDIYSFGGVTHRAGASAGFYRFPKQESQVVAELYPLGFLPEIHTRIDDLSSGVGVKGTVNDWQVDFSAVYGRNDFRYFVENSNNASYGIASPTSFEAGGPSFSQVVVDLDLVRPFETSLFETLALVAGTEFRLERYDIEAGQEASYALGPETYGDPPQPKVPGAQVFPGFSPDNEVSRTRNNVGAYLGLESAPWRWLTLDLGGRLERYSDFGEKVIGKAAARAEIFDGLALRGGVGTGFRAPSLNQVWFNNISTLFVQDPETNTLVANQTLTSANASPITRAFGIPELKEETSLHLTGGITLQPAPSLSITLDGYYIQVDDRIAITSQFSDSDPVAANILAPFPGVSQAQFFANAVDTSTMGLDLVTDFAFAFASHQFKLALSANLNRTTVDEVHLPDTLATTAADQAQRENAFFGRLQRNRLESASPRRRGTASLLYTLGPVSALVRGNYYGEVKYRPDNPANDETFGGKMLFDVQAKCRLFSNLSLTVGADNLFNTFPDQQRKAANTSSGRFIYNRNVSQFGMNGGFYYARLEAQL